MADTDKDWWNQMPIIPETWRSEIAPEWVGQKPIGNERTRFRTDLQKAMQDPNNPIKPKYDFDSFRGRQEYKDKLLRSEINTPNSNSYKSSDYIAQLHEYGYRLEAGTSPNLDYENPHIGHKLHLNVAPQHVKYVSDYLKHGKYSHKYCTGDYFIESGKIFTIYIGSFDLAYKSAKQINDELAPYLLDPVSSGDCAYYPKVAGRFMGDRRSFSDTNTINGISSSHKAESTRLWGSSLDPKKEAFDISFEELADKYGKFFHG